MRRPAAHSRRRRSPHGPDPPHSRYVSGSRVWRWPRPSSAGCCSATPILRCGRMATGRCGSSCRRPIAFSIGGAVLLELSQGALARRRLIDLRTAGRACPAAGRALVGRNDGAPARSAKPLFVANSIATDLFIGLSLTVLPQLYPDGPLPGRLWKVLLGVSAGLVVIATLQKVQLPDRLRSVRVVFLVDRSRPRLADRPSVADRPLAPGHSPCCGGR